MKILSIFMIALFISVQSGASQDNDDPAQIAIGDPGEHFFEEDENGLTVFDAFGEMLDEHHSSKKKKGATQGATVRIVVSKARQRMMVYYRGQHKYTWKVSTGSVKRFGKGANTPKGSWRPFLINAKYRTHKRYGGRRVILPYGIKYYKGFLIHGTRAVGRLGSKASHGCIRLSMTNARTLFNMVQRSGKKNTLIVVN